MDTAQMDSKTSHIYFTIGKEYYAINVSHVLEILQLEEYTRIPNSSKYIKGVMNFRGSVVPIIDMHQRFQLTSGEDKNYMAVIIEVNSNDNKILMGLRVDEVKDVIEFEYKDIKKVNESGLNYSPEFLNGMVNRDDRFILVLNLDKVLNADELAELNEAIIEQKKKATVIKKSTKSAKK